MRDPNDFADVELENLGFGSLAGAGADHHDSIKSKMSPDGSGFDYQISCEKCGKTLILSVPWTELIFIRRGLLPPNNSWIYNQKYGRVMPANTCGCGEPLRLAMTPEEASRNLTAGIAARKLNPGDVARFEQQAGLSGPQR